LELDPRFGLAAALAGYGHSVNVSLGYSINPQFERMEAVRLLRLTLSIDDDDSETLAQAAVVSTFMISDHESAIEMTRWGQIADFRERLQSSPTLNG